MIQSTLKRRIILSAARQWTPKSAARQQRWLTPAPKAGDGPLMERRADRELPDVSQSTFRWRRTLPLFAAVIVAAGAAIFNYQKASSPIVSGTLYALRTSQRARDLLGDEIYFRHQIPLVRGEMNQLRGRIDIRFAVKGTRAAAVMRFASHRPSSRGLFETTEWSLETDDGRRIDLLEDGDPFRGLQVGGGPVVVEDGEEELGATTRGFRQMPK